MTLMIKMPKPTISIYNNTWKSHKKWIDPESIKGIKIKNKSMLPYKMYTLIKLAVKVWEYTHQRI